MKGSRTLVYGRIVRDLLLLERRKCLESWNSDSQCKDYETIGLRRGDSVMKRIIIVGGGVAGLAAAYKITRAASEGHDVEFVLLEKDRRLGGKIQTEVVMDPSEESRFIVDGGPDCFLTEKPACHRIAKLTGIFDDELPTDDSRRRTWILSRGKLHQMPDGVMMFAPTKFVPFATTGLFSWPGKIRMAMDLLIPPKKVAPGEVNEETLESFVVRRMGRECLDRLAEPLVGGVHASDPKQMSLAATFPRLLEMEQNYGSLLKAFIAIRRKVEEMRRKYPAKPGEKPRTFFTSFVKGMQQLTDSMADAAGRERMRTGVSVSSLQRTSGGGWRALTLRRFYHRRRCSHHRHRVMGCRAAHPAARPGHRRRTGKHPGLFLGDDLDRLQRERGRFRSECVRSSVSPRGGPCAHGGYLFLYQVAGPGTGGKGAAARFRRRSAQSGDFETLGRGTRADGTCRVP